MLAVPSQAYGISGGGEAADGAYRFVARVDVGGERSCSGVLIDPQWIATAASCFAENGQPPPAGPPAKATTVTVGRANILSGTGGQVRRVVELVPREDRDLVLLRTTTPVSDITPAKIRATPPAVGDVLRVAGFGRTATDWVPDRMHTGTFSVQSVAGTSVTIAGDATSPAAVCKGDAGGPAFRETAGGAELVALNSTSWQAGCLAETETRQGASEVRLDDVASWIAQTIRGATFVRLPTATRVLDTRSGVGAPAGALGAGGTKAFPVVDVGSVPGSHVTAVLVDVEVVGHTAGTFLTLWPAGGAPRPNASMVNAAPNQLISNSVVVEVTDNGNLSVYNFAGTTHVVVDVQGYFTRSPSTGTGFVAVPHTRLVDTRSGLGGFTGEIPGGQSRTFTLTGGVIPTGATAAFLDVIVTSAETHGWVGTFPTGGGDTSVMDYATGTTSVGVTAKIGSDGKVTFSNHGSSAVHLVLTAEGYFTASHATGATFRGLPVGRLLDTRSGGGAPVPPNGTLDLSLRLPPSARAGAVLNLTVVGNTASGFLHVWPADGTATGTSLLNYPAPNTSPRSSLAVVPASTDGKVRIRNASGGTVHIVVDVQGWFVAPTLTFEPTSGVENAGIAAEDDTMPSTVEIWDYPGAAQILAQRGITLGKGDGHIVLVDCGANPNSPPADLILVQTNDLSLPGDPNFCFKAKGASGYLTMQISQVYLIRGENSRTIAAKVETQDDPAVVEVEQVDPQEWQPVGVGQSRGDATVLELRFPYSS